MGGTVVPNLADISLCESVGSWTGSPTPTVQDILVYTAKQGTYCLQSYSASAVTRSARWDFGSLEANWKNFAGNFLYSWFAFSMKDYSAAAGTLTIRLTDGAGRNRNWNLFNKTALPHIGWIGWCIHADYGYDSQDSGFDVTKIRYVGWLTTDTLKGKVYVYFDAWRFGTGLSIKSGTSESPAVFEDFYTDELTQAYGVVDKIGDVYFVKGQIAIGSMTIDESTYFKDSNQVIIFQDIKGTPSGVYGITGQRYDGGTGTTKIFFGADGIGGSVIKASSAMKFNLTMTDLGVTEFGFHGCTLQNAGTISLPVYNVNKIVLNCSFITGGELLASTCTITGCSFISTTGRTIRISSASHRVTKCNFINCYTAIHHDVGGPVGAPLEYDYDSLIFTGGTYHIENSSNTPNFYILIDRLGVPLSDPDPAKILNSGTGYTTLKDISLHLTLDKLVAGSEIIVLQAGTQNVLAWIDTSGTSWVYDYYYSVGAKVDIFIHKEDYEWYSMFDYTLLASDATIPISQRKDRVYSNP